MKPYRFCFLFLALLVCKLSYGQSPRFDVRLNISNVDCVNERLIIDIEIKATSLASQFDLAGQNYRFSFDPEVLANPVIENELVLSGVVSHSGGSGVYGNHSLTGSAGSIISYNVPFFGGDGYPLNAVNWLPVGQVGFDLVNPGACPGFTWLTQADFPPTTITQDLNTSEPPVPEGNYFTTALCLDTVCGPFPCKRDKFEDNDLQSNATNLVGGILGGTTDMYLCPDGDVDWYFFDHTHGGQSLRIELFNLPADYDMELYDAGGLLMSAQNPGTANELLVVPQANAGRYWVKIYGKNGAWNPVRNYLLTVNSIQTPPIGSVGTKPSLQQPLTRTEDELELSGSKVFPNPATDRLNIQTVAESDGRVAVRLMDMTGRIVYLKKMDVLKGTNRLVIPTNIFSEGAYLLEWRLNGDAHQDKIVILKE